METDIFRSPHTIVTREEKGRVVRYRRTSVPLAGQPDFESEAHALESVLPRSDRARLGLLMDVRESPLRNEPGFEEHIGRFVQRLTDGFARSAVLVKTAVGKLQIRRLGRQQGTEMPVFDDEQSALAYLRGDASR